MKKPETCLSPARIKRYTKARRAAHRKHIKENRGGRDDRPAGTPGATPGVKLKAVLE